MTVLVPEPRVGVACLIRDHNNRLLMIKRAGSHSPGTWGCPGGWLEFGEDPAEAARREISEEVGLLTSDPLPAVGRYTSDFLEEEKLHCITLWFVCFALHIAGNDPKILEPEKVSEIAWVPIEGPYPTPLFLPAANRVKQVGRLVLP